MRKNSLIKKISVATVAGLTTFALVACSPDDGENSGNDGSNSISSENNSDNDNSDEANDNDATQIQNVATSYFTESFTTSLSGGQDTLLDIQTQMVEVTGADAFSNPDPYAGLNDVSDEDKQKMIEITQKYVNPSEYFYYGDENEKTNELLGNIVTLTFQSIIGSEFSGSALEVIVDKDKISVDGDNATIPSDAFGLKSEEQVIDDWPFGIDVKMVKMDDGWKIDSYSLIQDLLAPAPQ